MSPQPPMPKLGPTRRERTVPERQPENAPVWMDDELEFNLRGLATACAMNAWNAVATGQPDIAGSWLTALEGALSGQVQILTAAGMRGELEDEDDEGLTVEEAEALDRQASEEGALPQEEEQDARADGIPQEEPDMPEAGQIEDPDTGAAA